MKPHVGETYDSYYERLLAVVGPAEAQFLALREFPKGLPVDDLYPPPVRPTLAGIFRRAPGVGLFEALAVYFVEFLDYLEARETRQVMQETRTSNPAAYHLMRALDEQRLKGMRSA